MEEAPARFESGAQMARVKTEQWAGRHLYCPNCGKRPLAPFPNNAKVADFHCSACPEEFELKSKKSRIGDSIPDGAYSAMMERLNARNNPNLFLLNYDAGANAVRNLIVVPKQFFVPDIVQKRKPLALTARRAGWIGCNILLRGVPDAGKIYLVRDGQEQDRNRVMDIWRRTLFLRDASATAKGWTIEVLRAVDALDLSEFTLEDIYSREAHFHELYPNNNNVRPKLRQQLQILRDHGLIEFLGRGAYRRRSAQS